MVSIAGGTARLPGDYGRKVVSNVENNGHAFQLNYMEDGGGVLRKDGKAYVLRQFHFHSPSEHVRQGYAGWTDPHGKKYPGHYAMMELWRMEVRFRSDNHQQLLERMVAGCYLEGLRNQPDPAQESSGRRPECDHDHDLRFRRYVHDARLGWEDESHGSPDRTGEVLLETKINATDSLRDSLRGQDSLIDLSPDPLSFSMGRPPDGGRPLASARTIDRTILDARLAEIFGAVAGWGSLMRLG